MVSCLCADGLQLPVWAMEVQLGLGLRLVLEDLGGGDQRRRLHAADRSAGTHHPLEAPTQPKCYRMMLDDECLYSTLLWFSSSSETKCHGNTECVRTSILL